MTPELLAMLGGGVSGFVMKMIASQADNQARLFERMIQKQVTADESADRAAARGGIYMRRAITFAVIFAIVLAPFIFAFTDIGVTLQTESKGFLGLFKGLKWSTVQGFVILNNFSHRRVLLWFIPSQITNNIMPQGKGTYGSKVGRPAGKGKAMPKRKKC